VSLSGTLRRVLWMLPVLLALGIGFYALSPLPSAPSRYTPVTVKRGDLLATVSATGTVNPVLTVQVGSQVSGIIQHVHVDYNSRVRKGQVIAQIEPSWFKARVAQAEANLRSAEAARDKAWVAVQDAKRQWERMRMLLKRGMVAQSEADAAQSAYESALAQHKAQEALVLQARAALKQARVDLAHTTIVAPMDGVVISRNVDVGQTVSASLQAPTLFTIAQDLTQMQIETDVDEAFIGSVREGQPVTFTVFAYPDRVFQGRVAQVRLNPRVESGVVKYNCIIRVDNPDLALKPGMTATVSIQVDRRENVLKVPNEALRFVPDWPPERLDRVRKGLKRGEAVLWVPTARGFLPRVVQVGLVGEKETEVRGEGLKEGTVVAAPAPREEKPKRRRRGIRLF